MTYYTYYQSPLGKLMLMSNGTALTGLYFEVHKGAPVPTPDWKLDDAPFRATLEQLDAYFAGTLKQFTLPVQFEGTEFQNAVWRELMNIPFGEKRTYKEIAEKVGRPKAVRAVGAANGRNPICIIAGCHRVVGSDGTLTGYAAGLPVKEFLLALEAR